MSNFTERMAAQRAKFEAEWQAEHGPMCLTNDDLINPHKHVADTTPGARCMVDRAGLCHIPHDCRCPILWACSGGCYRTEVTSSAHPNRKTIEAPVTPKSFGWQQVEDAIDEGQPQEQIDTLIVEAVAADCVTVEAPLVQPIDRVKWTSEPRDPTLGTVTILVDDHDAGFAIPSLDPITFAPGFSVWLQDMDCWPDSGTEPKWAVSIEDAIAQVRAACEEYWNYCSTCGNKTTEDDRAVINVHADDIGVRCSECRSEPIG